MKKNEIALLILIIGISIGLAYLVGKAIFGDISTKPVEVETARAISADVTRPQEKIFNQNAINPTVPVTIGDGSNQQPFGNN